MKRIPEYRVTSKTEVQKLAGAIAHALRESGKCEVNAIGPAAVNQAIKACATARGYTASAGIDLIIIPCFDSAVVEEDGEKKDVTVIKLIVEGKH